MLRLSHYKGKRLKAVYRLPTSSSYHSQGSLHIICSPNMFMKRPFERIKKIKRKDYGLLLIILVTGNRKMEAWQSSCHSPAWVSLWSHRPPVATGQSVPEQTCPGRMVSSCPQPSEIPPPRELGVARMAQLHRVPSERQERCPEPTQWGSRRRRMSVCPMLSLFVLFVLFLVGTLGTEPLHLFWRCGH